METNTNSTLCSVMTKDNGVVKFTINVKPMMTILRPDFIAAKGEGYVKQLNGVRWCRMQLLEQGGTQSIYKDKKVFNHISSVDNEALLSDLETAIMSGDAVLFDKLFARPVVRYDVSFDIPYYSIADKDFCYESTAICYSKGDIITDKNGDVLQRSVMKDCSHIVMKEFLKYDNFVHNAFGARPLIDWTTATKGDQYSELQSYIETIATEVVQRLYDTGCIGFMCELE